MTLADLVALVRERSTTRAREMVSLAWHTAYYYRVKSMPDLHDELDAIGGDHSVVDEDGGMSEARHDRIWAQLRGYFQRSNAAFAARGA